MEASEEVAERRPSAAEVEPAAAEDLSPAAEEPATATSPDTTDDEPATATTPNTADEEGATATSSTAADEPAHADLTLIKGIGRAFAERLEAAGIRSFSRLAETDVERVAEILGWPQGRVERDELIEQARRLAEEE